MDKPVIILLITAHPDDEVMFFSPLIMNYKSIFGDSCEFYLLCLSIGNSESQGNIRKDELLNVCKYLSIPIKHVTIIDHIELQDGMNTIWNLHNARDIILKHFETIYPTFVVTFDSYGVSNHPNHIATNRATILALRQFESTRSHSNHQIIGYELHSHNIILKFTFFIGLLFHIFFSSRNKQKENFGSFPLLWMNPFKFSQICYAMTLHWSQLKWYRLLFIVFSRYSYLNEFHPIIL